MADDPKSEESSGKMRPFSKLDQPTFELMRVVSAECDQVKLDWVMTSPSPFDVRRPATDNYYGVVA